MKKRKDGEIKSNKMHELFTNVLSKRDLSRAGDLFSVPDSEIVNDISDVVSEDTDSDKPTQPPTQSPTQPTTQPTHTNRFTI